MKNYIEKRDLYYNVIKNNIIIKLFCKKIQLKGNYLSVRKRLFKHIHFKCLGNFEFLVNFSILKIFTYLTKLFDNKKRNTKTINKFNMHNFIYSIRVIFKIIRFNIKYVKGTVDLNDYLFYKFNKLGNFLLSDDTLYSKNKLNKIFFKNYSLYGYGLNDIYCSNFFYYKKTFVKRVYNYKFYNKCLKNNF